jgi:hypothetical protein
MREEPLESREAVLDLHGIGELGCQPVLHRRRDDVVLEHPLDEHREHRPATPADHAAAVHEEHAGRRFALMAGAVHHRDGDLHAAVSRNGVVGDLDGSAGDDLVERGMPRRGRTEVLNGLRLERHEVRGHVLQRGLQLGIERRAGACGHAACSSRCCRARVRRRTRSRSDASSPNVPMTASRGQPDGLESTDPRDPHSVGRPASGPTAFRRPHAIHCHITGVARERN